MKVVFRCNVKMYEKKYNGFTFKAGYPYRAFRNEKNEIITVVPDGTEIYIPSDAAGKIYDIFLA